MEKKGNSQASQAEKKTTRGKGFTPEQNASQHSLQRDLEPMSFLSLRPRDGEHVHVRLDVHGVRDRVDSTKGVCDLPVEIPDQLEEKVSVSMKLIQQKSRRWIG